MRVPVVTTMTVPSPDRNASKPNGCGNTSLRNAKTNIIARIATRQDMY
ncbi:hypothetical protein ACHAWT_000401 [Skeletonema menzelii]